MLVYSVSADRECTNHTTCTDCQKAGAGYVAATMTVEDRYIFAHILLGFISFLKQRLLCGHDSELYVCAARQKGDVYRPPPVEQRPQPLGAWLIRLMYSTHIPFSFFALHLSFIKKNKKQTTPEQAVCMDQFRVRQLHSNHRNVPACWMLPRREEAQVQQNILWTRVRCCYRRCHRFIRFNRWVP